jgi:hypothetical protein
MQRTRPAAVAYVGLPCAVAQAPPLPVRRKAFHILMRTARGVLAVTDQQLTDGAELAQQRLGPCSGALASVSAATALEPLAMELAAQYLTTALGPLYRLAARELTRAEALPLRPQLRTRLAATAAMMQRIQTLDFCSDFAAWQAAGFDPTQEPPGTQLASGFVNATLPSLDRALFFALAPRQQAVVRPVERQAAMHAEQLVAMAVRSFHQWAGR